MRQKAAIDAAVARFGQLDDYYIMDEVTVYFGNGQTNIDPKYNSQLLALADKAKTVNGYMIEVKGYASATGNPAFNQKLSEDRATTSLMSCSSKLRFLSPECWRRVPWAKANRSATKIPLKARLRTVVS